LGSNLFLKLAQGTQGRLNSPGSARYRYKVSKTEPSTPGDDAPLDAAPLSWQPPLPGVPNDVQQVLARLGRSAEGCSVQLLTTELGVSKYLVNLSDGDRWFVGHLSRIRSDGLEASMAAADAVVAHLDKFFQMAGYILTASGERLIEIDNGRRFMAVPFFPTRPADAGDRYSPDEHCRWHLPDAAASFHAAVRRSGADAAGLVYYSAKESIAYVLGNLRKTTSEPALDAALRADASRALAMASALEMSGVVAELDNLPLGVIHTDLQPKNLLLGTDGRTIRICDTETMGRGRRIHDLYFLFAGSDDNEKAGDWAHAVRALQQYCTTSQLPLDHDERRLLAAELQLNALCHTGWTSAACAARAISGGEYDPQHAHLLRAFTRAATAFGDADRVQRACDLAHCLAGFGPVGGLLSEFAHFFGASPVANSGEGASEAPPSAPFLPLPPLCDGETGAAIFYNGTFSPPHVGHLHTARLATEAALRGGYTRAQVLFSPCADGYERRKLGSFAVGASHRVAMLRAAGCMVDSFECERDEAAITLQGVRGTFVQRLPARWQPFFLSGADTSKWAWVAPELAVGVHRLIVVNRAGSDDDVTECKRGYQSRAWPGKLLVAYGEDGGRSSTLIRTAAASGGDLLEVIGVPEIAAYINANRLYAA